MAGEEGASAKKARMLAKEAVVLQFAAKHIFKRAQKLDAKVVRKIRARDVDGCTPCSTPMDGIPEAGSDSERARLLAENAMGLRAHALKVWNEAVELAPKSAAKAKAKEEAKLTQQESEAQATSPQPAATPAKSATKPEAAKTEAPQAAASSEKVAPTKPKWQPKAKLREPAAQTAKKNGQTAGDKQDRTVMFGNCPFEMEEDQLRKLFPNIQEIRMTRRNGTFTGAAFAVFPDSDEAVLASETRGLSIGDRMLRVRLAGVNPTKPKPADGEPPAKKSKVDA
eukprot:NODE_4876_length_1007_cov_72.450226_g4669_i0.p1 GENE.NODE_4876_length_1007_cov_72.450226_g4669_i0~~NODE_4876_length_1007_cov_72.450226_g4669_i0.p1  ORF type:complete len:282 (-),score=61.82 NODE_4876_length_1007_cov_72.450226_g4669_i0:85-930(-)